MACEIVLIEDNLVVARISGVMRLADLKALQDIAARIIAGGKAVRLLAVLEDFRGWDKAADWGNVDFFVAHGNQVARMAFVGDEHAREEVFAFVAKGLRDTEIEFFPTDRMQDAESWIRA